MQPNCDDTSTRKTILTLLKKNGPMSIDGLSRSISITPMGIRQHLMALEKKGVVQYIPQKHGIGRPVFIYSLTPKADSYFPSGYDTFTLDLLREVKKTSGTEKIRSMLNARKERMLGSITAAVPASLSTEERLNLLKNVLEAEGHLIEVGRQNGSWELRNFHCPVRKVAEEFPELCAVDLDLMRSLFGRSVTAEQTIAGGGICCQYSIPPN